MPAFLVDLRKVACMNQRLIITHLRVVWSPSFKRTSPGKVSFAGADCNFSKLAVTP